MTPQRFFYFLCLVLVALVIGGSGMYYTLSHQLTHSIDTMAQKEAQSESQDTQLSQLQDLQNQYKRLGTSSLLAEINEALPASKNESEIALQLRNIASQSGMTFTNLTFPDPGAPSRLSQTVRAGDALALPLTFTLSGTYAQLQTFLTQQEALSRYTSITNLSISASGELLAFTISLNAYLKP